MNTNNQARTKLSTLIFGYAHFLAAAVFTTVLIVGYFILSGLLGTVIERTVVNNAQTVSTALTAVRSLYTREVVEVARAEGIEISHQFQEVSGVIPLPASLTIELGEAIATGPTGASTALYSPYPFPWRQDAGLNDSFRVDAWEAISQNPSEPFVRTELFNGVASVRYATADFMRDSCVNCHNSHPQSPKTDWQVGDVRGLLEVIQPIGAIQKNFTLQVQKSYLGFSALIALGALGMIIVFLAYQRRIAENSGLLTRLEDNNANLTVLNDELQQFAYRTSHDLKAPLLSIKGLSQYIIDDLDDGDLDEARDNVAKVRKLSENLEATINGMLNLTKAEYITRDAEVVQFEELTNSVLDNLQGLIDESGVVVSKDFNHVWNPHSNEVRLKQILENLISNGIKYACKKQDAPSVTVMTKTTKTHFTITIKDNGIGIPADKRADVFSMFTRFHPTQSAGSGLGLYLVKKHVDALGGEIDFKSNNGTEFIIELPETQPGAKV